jgi:hypothetical protein
VIDVIGQIGPFDKAKLGWATAMPLVRVAGPAALVPNRLPAVDTLPWPASWA